MFQFAFNLQKNSLGASISWEIDHNNTGRLIIILSFIQLSYQKWKWTDNHLVKYLKCAYFLFIFVFTICWKTLFLLKTFNFVSADDYKVKIKLKLLIWRMSCLCSSKTISVMFSAWNWLKYVWTSKTLLLPFIKKKILISSFPNLGILAFLRSFKLQKKLLSKNEWKRTNV